MRVIGIETSGTVGSVALVDGEGRVLGEETFEKGLRHGQALVPALERVLARAGVEKRAIDAVAVGIGPGSYTGLRVGIAAARSVAYALEKPLLGVPSFDAIAAALPPEIHAGRASVVVAEDARRDHVYVGRYVAEGTRLRRAAAFDVVPPERALEGAPRPLLLVGNAAARYPAILVAAPDVTAAPPEAGHAHARSIARLALERIRRGDRDPIHQVAPLYLRPSLPEEKRGR